MKSVRIQTEILKWLDKDESKRRDRWIAYKLTLDGLTYVELVNDFYLFLIPEDKCYLNLEKLGLKPGLYSDGVFEERLKDLRGLVDAKEAYRTDVTFRGRQEEATVLEFEGGKVMVRTKLLKLFDNPQFKLTPDNKGIIVVFEDDNFDTPVGIVLGLVEK